MVIITADLTNLLGIALGFILSTSIVGGGAYLVYVVDQDDTDICHEEIIVPSDSSKARYNETKCQSSATASFTAGAGLIIVGSVMFVAFAVRFFTI